MSAKEVFIDLNFRMVKNNEELLIYGDMENEDLNIVFYKKYKAVGGNPYYDYYCDMPLLKAINKQVEELNWNE